ncbi:exocyst complex component EXO70C2-like [Cicer arietinum]|uniref:Exocyst subunit Exo70 family protein n=1 Tax=Cicer arietinum TaxID=3827 RepID=A0A1S2XNM5_CICAR|nr:exocyst complex component EXO70B1-like [Cicer arietinum]
MEKNLAENSDSFAPRDETPMPDPKRDGNADAEEPPPPPSNNDEEQTEEEKKEEETAETVDAVESPPPSLEKVSEEIDQFLVETLEEKEKERVSFEIHGYVGRFLDLIEEKLEKCETGEGKAKWEEVIEKDTWLLESVNRISKFKKTLTRTQNHDENETMEEKNEGRDSIENRVGVILQRAMSFLEEDFRLLIEESRTPTELVPDVDPKGKHVERSEQKEDNLDHQQHEESESEMNFPGYTDEAIAYMSKIAGEMLTGGYESECCQVYIVARRTAFEEILQKLGFERISIDDMIQKIQWETLARDMIPAWTNTFRQCTAVYLPGERKLAEAVFSSQPSVAENLFSSLSRGVVIPLLNFAEGAAMTKRAGEKLFKLLDMYETLRDIIPKLDGLFPEESLEELTTEINLAKSRLGEAAISIFCELENSIKSETAKNPVPGGAVHPLTRYIMNYLNIAGDYKETLEQVFKDHSRIEHLDSTSRPFYQENQNQNQNDVVDEKESSTPLSPFTAQVMRVMELLDTSLDGKAKLYRDVALSNFFMMNNGRYILQKIKGSSEMRQVMGDTWCKKKSFELRNYHKNYQRETWNRVLTCLSHEGLSVNGKVQKPVLKERFKGFNALFDEIHRTQSSWVVKDEQLQSELRVSISAVVIPAYRAFMGRFAQYLDAGRQTEKYVKFQPEDIETYIDELFEGKPQQSTGRRKT